MLIVTTNSIPGREINKTFGLVRGTTVRARHLGQDILASLKNLVGGEIQQYAKLFEDARAEAIERMIKDAEEQGADAIVAVRFTTSVMTDGAAEIMAFGTAVKTRLQ